MRDADLHETAGALGFVQARRGQFARRSQLTAQLGKSPLAGERREALREVVDCRRKFRGAIECGLRFVGSEAFRPSHGLAVVGLQLHLSDCSSSLFATQLRCNGCGPVRHLDSLAKMCGRLLKREAAQSLLACLAPPIDCCGF